MLDITDLVRHTEFLDALDDYGIVLTEPPQARRWSDEKRRRGEGAI